MLNNSVPQLYNTMKTVLAVCYFQRFFLNLILKMVSQMYIQGISKAIGYLSNNVDIREEILEHLRRATTNIAWMQQAERER